MLTTIFLSLVAAGLVGFAAGTEWQLRRWNRGVGYWKDEHIKALKEHVEVLQRHVETLRRLRDADEAWHERKDTDANKTGLH